MKSKPFDLQANLVTTYGDTSKTFITSTVSQKTIESKTVIGPVRNVFFPVFDDVGNSPIAQHLTPNNRLFTVNAPAGTGLARITLHDFNPLTGVQTFVGSFNMTLLASTQTVRGLKVYDGASEATVTGWKVFLCTTAATAANGGVYMANSIAKTDFSLVPATIPTATTADSKQIYKLENSPFTLTSLNGIGLERPTQEIWVRNGSATVYQIAKFTFSGSTGTPGANGIITTFTTYVTGNLPATSGTLIQNNHDLTVTPGHGPNSGQLCYLFSTSTGVYHGRISELGAAVTAWPTLTVNNYQIPGGLYLTPTASGVAYSTAIDRLIVLGGVETIVVKQLASNQADYLFGTAHSLNFEGGNYVNQPILPFGGFGVANLSAANGWLVGSITTTGQRGVAGTRLLNDSRWVDQYIISKVLDVNDVSAFRFVSILRVLNKYTATPKVQYRQSGFASQTVGWLDWPDTLEGQTILPTGPQIQFRILFRQHDNFITTTVQMLEAYLGYSAKYENSEHWNSDLENTTKAADSPAKSAAILILAYASSVPAIQMSVYARSNGALVLQKNTSAHAAEFSYSTNNGGTWNALGTIPNTINTTRLRYNWSTPIPEDVDIVWSEL